MWKTTDTQILKTNCFFFSKLQIADEKGGRGNNRWQQPQKQQQHTATNVTFLALSWSFCWNVYENEDKYELHLRDKMLRLPLLPHFKMLRKRDDDLHVCFFIHSIILWLVVYSNVQYTELQVCCCMLYVWSTTNTTNIIMTTTHDIYTAKYTSAHTHTHTPSDRHIRVRIRHIYIYAFNIIRCEQVVWCVVVDCVAATAAATLPDENVNTQYINTPQYYSIYCRCRRRCRLRSFATHRIKCIDFSRGIQRIT